MESGFHAAALAAGLATALAMCAPAAAQQPAGQPSFDARIKRGADLKVWSRKMDWSERTARVDSTGPDTIVVAVRYVVRGKGEDRRYLLPIWDFDSIEVRVPRLADARLQRHLTFGGLIGAAIGAAVGVVALSTAGCGDGATATCSAADLGIGGAASALAGGAAGVAVGALVSTLRAVNTGVDEWVPVKFTKAAG